MNKINYLIYSKAVSLLGSTVFNVSISLWVISVYGSSAELGKVLAVAGFSSVIFNLLGGYIGDLWNKEKILKYADLISGAFCILSIVVFKNININVILIIVFILNMNYALTSPVVKSFIPQIVSKDNIVKYNSKLALISEIIKVLMPVITTYIFGKGIISINHVLFINGITYIISFMFLQQINVKFSNYNKGKNSYLIVIRYLKKKPIIQYLLLTSMVSNFILAGFNLILPVYAAKVLNMKEYYGILLGAESIGAVIGAFSANFFLIDKSLFKERVGLFLGGAILILPFFLPSLFIGIIVCFCLNFFLSRYNIAFQSYLQINTPVELVGKTFSFSFVIIGIAVPIGNLFFGFLGELWISEIFIILSFGLMITNAIWIIFTLLSKRKGNPNEIIQEREV